MKIPNEHDLAHSFLLSFLSKPNLLSRQAQQIHSSRPSTPFELRNLIRSLEALHGYSLAPAILFFVMTALCFGRDGRMGDTGGDTAHL